jgi:hypothetical protein
MLGGTAFSGSGSIQLDPTWFEIIYSVTIVGAQIVVSPGVVTAIGAGLVSELVGAFEGEAGGSYRKGKLLLFWSDQEQ